MCIFSLLLIFLYKKNQIEIKLRIQNFIKFVYLHCHFSKKFITFARYQPHIFAHSFIYKNYAFLLVFYVTILRKRHEKELANSPMNASSCNSVQFLAIFAFNPFWSIRARDHSSSRDKSISHESRFATEHEPSMYVHGGCMDITTNICADDPKKYVTWETTRMYMHPDHLLRNKRSFIA